MRNMNLTYIFVPEIALGILFHDFCAHISSDNLGWAASGSQTTNSYRMIRPYNKSTPFAFYETKEIKVLLVHLEHDHNYNYR